MGVNYLDRFAVDVDVELIVEGLGGAESYTNNEND